MIKQFRRKIIAVSMIAITVVLCTIIGIINIANYSNVISNSDRLLQILVENQGTFPQNNIETKEFPKNSTLINPQPYGDNKFKSNHQMTAEEPFETRYFTVTLDSESNIISTNTNRIAAIDEQTAQELATELFINNKSHGFYQNYKFVSTQVDSHTMYIFLDCSRSLSSFYSFLFASISVSLLGILLFFILVIILSKYAVKPIAVTYEKQKRFITDASHEIKTPLTIIDANTEVLEMDNGENNWTKSIKNQVMRLTDLTNQLVMLSRMDESSSSLDMQEFSLSKAVSDGTDAFFTVAKSNEKELTVKIEPELNIIGNEKSINELISIMLDNAIKYSSPASEIKVSLKSKGKRKELIFENNVEEITKGNLDVLFERFYRYDSSRNSQTGGSGIGLSVAKAIVQAHKGKITAKSDDGKSIVFTVIL